MLKISRQMTEVFRNHMLETCGNTLKTLSNLEICCVMIENKYIFFLQSNSRHTQVSGHTSETNTRHKSTDTRNKL